MATNLNLKDCQVIGRSKQKKSSNKGQIIVNLKKVKPQINCFKIL